MGGILAYVCPQVWMITGDLNTSQQIGHTYFSFTPPVLEAIPSLVKCRHPSHARADHTWFEDGSYFSCSLSDREAVYRGWREGGCEG